VAIDRNDKNGKTRAFQNESGHTITERFNDMGIVTYRKTLNRNGSYVLEYFDDNGLLARKLKFFCSDSVNDYTFNTDGKRILLACYPGVDIWQDIMENGGIFPLSNLLGKK
jgi:hypothetical protein